LKGKLIDGLFSRCSYLFMNSHNAICCDAHGWGWRDRCRIQNKSTIQESHGVKKGCSS
jgi:hypothetical protein